MATSGVYGFINEGEIKATYNHSGSFLYDLGESIVGFINSTSLEEMKKICNGLIMVNELEAVYEEQINECKPIIEQHGDMFIHYNKLIEKAPPEYKDIMRRIHYPYDNRHQDDWYSLLRPAQGGLNAWKHGLKYMTYSSDCVGDMNYTYLLDLDKEQLIIYRMSSMVHEIPFETLKGKTLIEVIGEEEEE